VAAFWAAGPAGIAAAPAVNARVEADADLARLQSAFADLAEAMRPSVVAIRAVRRLPPPEDSPRTAGARRRRWRGRPIPSVGSGVVIRADGWILTNEHVVEGAERTAVILYDGTEHAVVEAHTDPRSDLAVIRVEATDLVPAALGDLERVRQGHWAFAMGNPFGLGADGGMAMAQGIVSAIGRKLEIDPTEARYYGNLIQTTAAINPGNSGGPLVNIYGEVIGITTAISTRTGGNEGIGFAVPMERRTKDIIDRLLRGEPVEYGYIGVVVQNPPEPWCRLVDGTPLYGALIVGVEASSPADQARLERGDRITHFDGEAVEDSDHLVRLVGAAPIGHEVPVRYERGDRSATALLTIARRHLPDGTPPAHLAWRGITFSRPTREIRRQFDLPGDAEELVVTKVEAGSAGERAGVQPGRRLKSIGGHEAGSIERLSELVPGLTGTVRLTFVEGGSVDVSP
jgi:S1-C subfamily serine protease